MDDPFDPDWDLERAIDELSARHAPGSLISGKTRNQLLRAWALVAGRERTMRDFNAAVAKRGSRTAVARHFAMRPSTLRELEQFFSELPNRSALPMAIEPLQAAFSALSLDKRAEFVAVLAQLLADPAVVTQLRDPRLRDHLSTALRGALRTADLQAAADELTGALEAGEAHEKVYQDWCDRHPWAFGHAYVMRDEVRRLDARNIVDLLLTDLAGFRDVVELKRPDARVLRADPSHGSYFFSSDASRAIGQAHKYMDVLQDTMSRSLEAHPLLVAYHPRATIVIGRSDKWRPGQTRALRGLNARMHNITVMTYDHLVAQAKQLLRLVSDQQAADAPV
jgi:hypothetical protein